ncbi:MAG: hypothetical protein LBG31_05865 [Prevotellaceae bacterium]|jgi:uncharacterized lipoprotein YajG|nr:hypothetical protein [Prevotellaceae bacterium]
MKKILLFLCLLLLAASCATQKQTANNAVPYVYYTGDDAPAASAMFRYTDEQ